MAPPEVLHRTARLLLALTAGGCVAAPAPPSANLVSLPCAPGVRISEAKLARATPSVASVYTAGLASPQFASLSAALEDGVTASFPGLPVAVGRAQVTALHGLLFGAFDDRVVHVRRVLKAADAEVIEWTITGVQARDWMGMTATRAPVVIEGVTLLWAGADHGISDVHVYCDIARVKAELGAGPAELRGLPAPPVPTGPTERATQTESSTELGDVMIVRTELDALELGDRRRYLATMADDVTVRSVEIAEVASGKTDVGRYYDGLHKAIASLDAAVSNVWGIGEFVVVEYSIRGLQTSPLYWVPATTAHDRVVTLHLVDVVDLRDERIRHISRYDDPEEVLAGPSL